MGHNQTKSAASAAGLTCHVPDLDNAGTIDDPSRALKVLGLTAGYTMEEANRALAKVMDSSASGAASYLAIQSYRCLERMSAAAHASPARQSQTSSSSTKHKAQPINQSTSDKAKLRLDQLIRAAEAEYASFSASEATQASAVERAAFQSVACAFAVVQVLMKDVSLRERYFEERELTVDGRSSLNPMHPLVKGLFPKEQWSRRKGLISKHADVIFALHDAKVSPEKVVQWLNEPDQNVGGGETGYRKAEAALKAAPAWAALKTQAQRDRLKERNTREDELLEALLKQKPLHVVEKAAGTEDLPDCFAVLAAHITGGRVELHMLTTDRPKVTSIIDRLTSESKGRRGKSTGASQQEGS
ncbi:hypothetical protein MBRA_02612 [Methylobacterium brachiatum]|jgi:hypothetical protein|nr:hypothetical protein MBRA_02612 [Methylobacterium brachiatum]